MEIATSAVSVPRNEQTSHIYAAFAQIREEIIMKPTPTQWDKLKEIYGDAYASLVAKPPGA